MAEWGHGDVEGTWAADCEVCGWHATFDSEKAAQVAAEAHHHDQDLEH
jgi:hypothetical protein